MIITRGVDKVAFRLTLLDKIVQSDGSEKEKGRGVCEGTILTCQNNCLCFICGPAVPVALHKLMILCLLSLLLGMVVVIDLFMSLSKGVLFDHTKSVKHAK